MSATTAAPTQPTDSKTEDNPYLRTYLRNHKEINLPEKFASNTITNENNRTDYKSLPKVKLFTISNILSNSDCNTLISKTNSLGYVPISFEYPEDYRKCERVIVKSHKLASIIWNKIIPYFNRSDIEDIRPYGFGNDGIWRPTHINEALRFTRYRNGDFFKPHRDGGYTKSNLNRSVYTIMIYLNDDTNDEFTGGDTVFYSLTSDKNIDQNKDENSDLFLDENDMKTALKVTIKPTNGMAVIFNHDVWHKGCVVNTKATDKYKFILRSDIMFECYSCETYNRNNLMADPLYIKSQKYYKLTIDLQNKGLVKESTISYLKALSIQTTLPSVIVDKNNEYYGEEYYWFTNNIYEYIFSFLDVYRLINVCYVSRAWNYYGSSPNLWKMAYVKYFNINEIQSMSNTNNTEIAYNTLFRPWKHIFSYRVMIKKVFPIVCLNMWFNGIEIGASSKPENKKQKQSVNYYNNDQKLMNKNDAQYIPFAISEYKESNYWSWKPYRKETLFGQIVFTGTGYRSYGFQPPKWVIDENGILNGLYFYKLLSQILYFPNVVLSLSSIMYDNKLFMLYLKYMLTKFNIEKKSKIFCVMFKNMETEIAKYYKYDNCIVILNEHRCFSISVITNSERIIDKKLMKKYIASNSKSGTAKNCFPKQSSFSHYRDDYDSNFFIANVSNFDFISSINDQTNILNENYSEEKQKQEAMPELDRYNPYSHNGGFKFFNDSNTAPKPVVNDEKDEKETECYFEIGQKDEKLLEKMKDKMKGLNKNYLNSYKLDMDLVNDMYVGPNEGDDIAQNNDFAHLINRYNNNRNQEKIKRFHAFYEKNQAPFNNCLCYSPFDLVLALRDLVKECDALNVFKNEKKIPVVLVGCLTNFYGDFVDKFCDLRNEENGSGFDLEYVGEYIKNGGTKDIENRSSSLKQTLKSVVTPKEISNFKSISDVKNEIIIQTIKSGDEVNEENENEEVNETSKTKNEKVNKTTKTKKKGSKLKKMGSIFKMFTNK